MAAALVPGTGSVQARRAFLDTERYDAVAGDFLEGTPSAGVAAYLKDLAARRGSDPGHRRHGGRSPSRRQPPARAATSSPEVTVSYTNDRGPASGRSGSSSPLDRSGARSRRRHRCGTARPVASSPGCACTVPPGDAVLPWVAHRARVRRAGRPGGSVAVHQPRRLRVGPRPGRGGRRLDGGGDRTPADRRARLGRPADPRAGHRHRGLGRRPAAARLPRRRRARRPRCSTGCPPSRWSRPTACWPTCRSRRPGPRPTVPAAEVMVLAAADTPDDVLAALVERAGHEPRHDPAGRATPPRSRSVPSRPGSTPWWRASAWPSPCSWWRRRSPGSGRSTTARWRRSGSWAWTCRCCAAPAGSRPGRSRSRRSPPRWPAACVAVVTCC